MTKFSSSEAPAVPAVFKSGPAAAAVTERRKRQNDFARQNSWAFLSPVSNAGLHESEEGKDGQLLHPPNFQSWDLNCEYKACSVHN
jgi:hypothetical protein